MSYFLVKNDEIYSEILRNYLKSTKTYEIERNESIKLLNNKFGTNGGFIVYLLLDPRVLVNSKDNFETFIKSILYVGRGQGERPLDHWLDLFKTNNSSSNCKKSQFLLILNNCDRGYIPLIYKFTLTRKESIVREFCLINLLNTENLLNLQKGSIYKWSESDLNNDYVALSTLIDMHLQR